jgi:tetratricopeptide (TPR) repeat protein
MRRLIVAALLIIVGCADLPARPATPILLDTDIGTDIDDAFALALIPVMALVVIGIHRRLGRGALPLCLVLAAGLSVVTWRRNGDYRSALSLWADTVAHCPANAFAHNNLGCELTNLPGRTPAAIAQYEEALRLKPDVAAIHINLAVTLLKTPGQTNEAVAHLKAALRLQPENDLARQLLAKIQASRP